MKTPIIVYMFSRREIESTDTSRFHENFRPGGTPPGVPIPLVEAMGNVMFVVDGYDDCPEDIYAILEIRSFLKNLHSAWPCWLFFSDLDSANLRVHTLCMLEDVQILREKQSGLTRTRNIAKTKNRLRPALILPGIPDLGCTSSFIQSAVSLHPSESNEKHTHSPQRLAPSR